MLSQCLCSFMSAPKAEVCHAAPLGCCLTGRPASYKAQMLFSSSCWSALSSHELRIASESGTQMFACIVSANLKCVVLARLAGSACVLDSSRFPGSQRLLDTFCKVIQGRCSRKAILLLTAGAASICTVPDTTVDSAELGRCVADSMLGW